MSLPLPFRLTFSLLLSLCVVLGQVSPAGTRAVTPAAAAEALRATLATAQLELASDPSSALSAVQEAGGLYEGALSSGMSRWAPEAHQRAMQAFAQLQTAAQNADAVSFAAARSGVWSALLAGALQIVETALDNDDAATARAWLALREFRTATRYSRPGGDATLALERFAKGEMPAGEALLAVRADLLDAYQARLGEALRSLAEAGQNGFAIRRAELAAQAEGYFTILAPAYAQQRGDTALASARQAFAALGTADDLPAALAAVNAALDGFRAAPLSPAEQARRAGQLLRFVSLIPVEYGRGVNQGRVLHDFEIQEATTFHAAALAAFNDLRELLPAGAVSGAAQRFERLGTQLAEASRGENVADPAEVRQEAEALAASLTASMPEGWRSGGSQGDFDVIASLLGQVEAAVRRGDYRLAESARLEAYAILETGPEARLMISAPHLTPGLESLFWNGQDEHKGLAYLLRNHAPLGEVQGSLAGLESLLAEAELVLGHESSPLAAAANAGMIVFREGMEAVVILASLMSSMRRAEERKYRRPMWLGTLAAFAATIATWMVARGVLQSLARYGERLEAVVSLIAVGVLLVITNWFFHKVYWTSWIAQFHNRKRRLLSGETGLMVGLVTLGFTSVYREGFEVVLFLQALVLEAGSGVVLAGIAGGMALVVLLGVLTFRLQVNLPYRNMLIVTGILIGAVLLQIVGKTAYALQIVGWLPIHAVHEMAFPYWWGSWFGVYPTWEGLSLQFLAGAFVIGSYYLAEWTQKNRRRSASPSVA